MNVKLVIEYDGSRYQGWQRQSSAPSIQETIEKAIAEVEGVAIPLIGASRTDSGVHAYAQVANFTASGKHQGAEWRKILNGILPSDIRIHESQEVDGSFHAIRSSTGKTYEYRMHNARVASALDTKTYFYPGPLDWAKMAEATACFLGERDFKSFQGARSSAKTTVRTVSRFEIIEESGGGGRFRFVVTGSGFLKQMVRAMVGTVVEVGEGKRPLDDIPRIFAARDRTQAGRTLPAQGLFLVKVHY